MGKEYNCPDCMSATCIGCQRTLPMPVTTTNFNNGGFLNDICKTCPNHFSNGGSGICNCMFGIITVY